MWFPLSLSTTHSSLYKQCHLSLILLVFAFIAISLSRYCCCCRYHVNKAFEVRVPLVLSPCCSLLDVRFVCVYVYARMWLFSLFFRSTIRDGVKASQRAGESAREREKKGPTIPHQSQIAFSGPTGSRTPLPSNNPSCPLRGESMNFRTVMPTDLYASLAHPCMRQRYKRFSTSYHHKVKGDEIETSLAIRPVSHL